MAMDRDKLKVLVIDNFDSFTFTLVDYLRTLGAEVRVERNDSLSVGQALADPTEALLISPGPGTPEAAGISVDLAKACIDRQRPLLGVCLGHQAIAVACGMRVDQVAPVHGKTSVVTHLGDGLFAGLPSPVEVTRYHSLAVTEVHGDLVATAQSDDGVVMAVSHRTSPVHGVQFHPESIATQHGHRLLGNFLKLAQSAIRA